MRGSIMMGLTFKVKGEKGREPISILSQVDLRKSLEWVKLESLPIFAGS